MSSNSLSRRKLLQVAGLQGLAFGMGTSSLVAAADPVPVGPFTPLNRFPRMVQEHFVGRVRAAEQAGEQALSKLKTKAEAEAHVRTLRGKIAQCFGPFPEKTPLNAKITGKVERDAYTIEKVIFESRPGFLVTANLYIPKGRKFPLPGVVGSCGHTINGKAGDAYQSFAQGLARLGYVVFIFDPIGQGERFQCTHVNEKDRPKPGVGEHLHAGNQQFLVGEFFGSWRAWDGIRALDYLLSRPEVDPRHVGITGNSGGGTMTTWLCGVEQRWTMAAPSCFVTTFRRNLENELPADTEQCPPRALALNLDHADFLAALAPKPIIILAKEKDFFDVRGSIEAFQKLKQLYKLLGAGENVALYVGPTGHGYSQENREAMYRWFNGVTKISDAKEEPKLTLEKDVDLWCTPKGQVADLKSRTVFSLTDESAKTLEKRRGKIAGEGLKKAIADMLKMPDQKGTPEFRILRTAVNRKYPKPAFTTYAVETKPGVFALVSRLTDQPLALEQARFSEGPADCFEKPEILR